MNRLANNSHVNGKLRFSAQDWRGPSTGDKGGVYWTSVKTGEKVYSPTNPGGQESQGEQPQQAGQQAKPDLKAIGAKYAAQAREKWGDKAHENLTKIAAGLEKDESPEAQKKLAAVKAMLQAVQAEAAPESPSEPSAEKPPAGVQGHTPEPAASEPSPGEPMLQPEKQQTVNERKRSGMALEAVAAERQKQYANTDRGRAEADREKDDAELKVKRDAEDADFQERRDTMNDRHKTEIAEADDAITAAQNNWSEIEDKRSEEDDQIQAARDAEDDKLGEEESAEDDAVEKQRDEEDAAFEASKEKRDEDISDARDKEDEEIEETRSQIRDQLADAYHQAEDGTPEEAAAKKALDAFEANADKEDAKLAATREKEDEKRELADEKAEKVLEEKRQKEDDKRSENRDKVTEKRDAKRDKEDEKLQKDRDKEEADIDKEEEKLEAKKQKLEEKHSKEVDALDNEESSIEEKRAAEDEQAESDRDEEDEYFDDLDSKEHDKATELIDSFEETDDGPAKSPEDQLDEVRKYNEKAAKNGDRVRITWYEGNAFSGWQTEEVEKLTDDDFDRFCPLPNESKSADKFVDSEGMGRTQDDYAKAKSEGRISADLPFDVFQKAKMALPPIGTHGGQQPTKEAGKDMHADASAIGVRIDTPKSGSFKDQLYDMGRVDTKYLDENYEKLGLTNNETLRYLGSIYNNYKDADLPPDQVRKKIDGAKKIINDTANAIREKGASLGIKDADKVADFYATHGIEMADKAQEELLGAPRQSSMDYDGAEPIRYADDRISLDELRRMPGPEATAYAKGVLAMLARRPDLRKEFSLQDLAYLQMIAANDAVRYAAECIGAPKSDADIYAETRSFLESIIEGKL